MRKSARFVIDTHVHSQRHAAGKALKEKRQAEGIAAAKARGVKFGRPEKALPGDFEQMTRLWRGKNLPLSGILSACQISESTFYRRIREYDRPEGR